MEIIMTFQKLCHFRIIAIIASLSFAFLFDIHAAKKNFSEEKITLKEKSLKKRKRDDKEKKTKQTSQTKTEKVVDAKKLIEYAGFWQKIKPALYEQKKNLKPVYTQKNKNTQKESGKNTNKFKYTQTIAHLLMTLPMEKIKEKIVIDKKYKTLLEYYDSLVENNKEKERENLIDALIADANDFAVYAAASYKYTRTPYKELEKCLSKSTNFPFLFNELKNAIKREELFSNKFVFIQGYKSILDFLFDFVSILENYLFLENKKKERTIYRFLLELHTSISDLIKNEGEKVYEGKEPCSTINKYVNSVDLALWGNLNTQDECAYYFFLTNNNVQVEKTDILNALEEICKNVKLPFEKYKEDLSKILEKYKTISGKMKQIFIDPEHIKKLAYICLPNGYSYSSIKKNNPNHPKKALDIMKNMSINEILAMLRNTPNHELFNEEWGDCYSSFITLLSKNKTMDFLQARLLTNPVLLEALGAQTFYIFLNKESKEKQEIYNKELELLVKDMIIDALNNDTINGKSIKGREPLVVLYKELNQLKDNKEKEKIKKQKTKSKKTKKREEKMKEIIQQEEIKIEKLKTEEEINSLKSQKEWIKNVDLAICNKTKENLKKIENNIIQPKKIDAHNSWSCIIQ